MLKGETVRHHSESLTPPVGVAARKAYGFRDRDKHVPNPEVYEAKPSHPKRVRASGLKGYPTATDCSPEVNIKAF